MLTTSGDQTDCACGYGLTSSPPRRNGTPGRTRTADYLRVKQMPLPLGDGSKKITKNVTQRFTLVTCCVTLIFMIKTFKHKGLKELFEKGRTARIDAKLQARVIERLDAINAAPNLQALDLPGFNTHPLKQFKPLRYSIWVTGAWRITFEFDKGDAERVDLEQYH